MLQQSQYIEKNALMTHKSMLPKYDIVDIWFSIEGSIQFYYTGIL